MRHRRPRPSLPVFDQTSRIEKRGLYYDAPSRYPISDIRYVGKTPFTCANGRFDIGYYSLCAISDMVFAEMVQSDTLLAKVGIVLAKGEEQWR